MRISRRSVLAAFGAIGATGAIRPGQANRTYDDPRALYHALDTQPAERIDLDGGTIEIVFADGGSGLDRASVRDWVRLAASAMTAYFGRFPIRSYRLLVIAQDGARVGHGTTFGFRGSATRIHVGREADAAAFRDDWVLVHEMMHAALPDLPRRALWLQEGNATWLEPIARAQAGTLPIAEVWREAFHGMPRGAPELGEHGMDGTDRWGRLYWGGATFWLEAEIAIWEKSGGRRGLVDAMRAAASESGGNVVTWPPEQLMRTCDRACGVVALQPLYQRYSSERVIPDLSRIFERLGVRVSADDRVDFDPRAELAALTNRITQRQPLVGVPRR